MSEWQHLPSSAAVCWKESQDCWYCAQFNGECNMKYMAGKAAP